MARRNENWLPYVFNDLFDDMLPMPRRMSATAPAINVIERDNEYDVEIAAPGMTRDDFKVTLDADDNLVIDLEKKHETQCGDKPAAEGEAKCQCKQGGRYLRREFAYTKFHQTLLLPDDVDRNAISAAAQHGVLTVTLPKVKPEQQTREARVIDIK